MRKHLSPSMASHTLVNPTPCCLQELAWASYALLLNTNICGLAVFWDGRPVLARGLLAAPGAAASSGKGSKDEAAAATLAAVGSGSPSLQQATAAGVPLYCPDSAAIAKAGAASWPGVPEGAESLLAQPLLPLEAAAGSAPAAGSAAPRGVLLLVSERQRALSAKERAWAAAVAGKLCSVLNQI